MESTVEPPISAEDIELADDRESVALRREKFGALVQYIEHLESTVRGAEFEFGQERHFARFLLKALTASLKVINGVGRGDICYDLAREWGDEAEHLYREGSVRLESRDAFLRRLAKIVDSQNAEGAGHGQ